MAMFSDCPGCLSGDHSQHVHHWGKRPEGVIDGDFCSCSGDCAERAQAELAALVGEPQRRAAVEAGSVRCRTCRHPIEVHGFAGCLEWEGDGAAQCDCDSSSSQVADEHAEEARRGS